MTASFIVRSATRFALGLSLLALSPETALAEDVAQTPPERGLGLRVGVAATPILSTIRYQGPPKDVGSEPGLPEAPDGDLDYSTSAISLGGGVWASIGFRDGHYNRFALEASLILGGVIAGGGDLPHTDVLLLSLASVGPSYTRSLSPRWDLDAALRVARFSFTGGRDESLAYDNVIEFAPQYGFLGRLGGAYRLRPWGNTALSWGIEGGPQFGGTQSSYLGLAQVGISWD